MIEAIVPKVFETEVKNLPAIKSTTFSIMPFSDLVVSFLNHLSREILKNTELRTEPAFAALGFWLRKANLNQIIRENNWQSKGNKYSIEPLGRVFHVCPSNVDTMFFYSLVISLLAGNKNIVRISSKLDHAQMFVLFDLINESLKDNDYKVFKDYINIVRYERNDDINQTFSLLSDGRIIWGGDETVEQFKGYKTKPKVKDLLFADRISYTLIDTKKALSLNDENLQNLVQNLYNDIYTFDQKGCSSPHCLFLLGSKKTNDAFLESIYDHLVLFAEDRYDADIGSIATFKFNQLVEDILDRKIGTTMHTNNYLVLSELKSDSVPETCGTGYLYYTYLQKTEEIQDYIYEKVQSIGYFGLSDDQLDELASLTYAKGVDRIIPVGNALDFDYIWDGYNILHELVSLKTIRR